MHQRSITYLFLVFLSAIALHAEDDIFVTAAFEPSVISEGSVTNFVITVNNSRKRLDDIPARLPEELKVTGSTRSSSNISIVNGDYRATTTVSVPIETTQVGNFTVPAWEATISGKAYEVPATTLKVVPAGDELKDAILMRQLGVEEPFYIGETRKVSVELYIRNDTEANGAQPLALMGDAFILEGTKEAQKRSERYQNQLYTVYTWDTSITAISSGEQDLGWSIGLKVALPNQRPRPRLSMGGFINDFIDEQPQWKDVTVKTDAFKTQVNELPAVGKPDNFSGAIGKFTVEDKLSRTAVKEGEPITLTLTVKGKGNFSRIMAPEVDFGPGWKSYPPKSNFIPESGDPLNISGKKAFEYIFIPVDESITEIPSIPFSYFDPITEKYFNLSDGPREISVSPAQASSSTISATNTPKKDPIRKAAKQRKVYDLQLLSENWIEAIKPVFYKPAFLYLQAIPALFLGGLVWLRKRNLRMANDSSYARLVNSNRQLKQWSKELGKAQTSGDVAAFFIAARRMIQEASSNYFNRSLKSESLTRDEITEMLQSKQKAANVIDEMRVIFDQCDSLHFAGGQTGAQELPLWRERIEKLINQI